jgi:hypothetical protein
MAHIGNKFSALNNFANSRKGALKNFCCVIAAFTVYEGLCQSNRLVMYALAFICKVDEVFRISIIAYSSQLQEVLLLRGSMSPDRSSYMRFPDQLKYSMDKFETWIKLNAPKVVPNTRAR